MNFLKGRYSLSGITAITAALSISSASCIGEFKVYTLNDASSYEASDSSENIKEITFAHLNAADLRGNTTNLFQIISKEEALERSRWLADYLLKEKADFVALNEVDYKDSLKTGNLDQPQVIAEFMGQPFNYVLFDQYLKSPLWTTGNAMISKYPLNALHRHLFGEDEYGFDSRVDHFFKDFIDVEVKIGKREAHVVYTHFDDQKDEYAFRREEEVRQFADYIVSLKKREPDVYIIAAGDFNDTTDSPTLKKLLDTGYLHPPAKNFGVKTYQAGEPYEGIDHILVSDNITIKNYRTFDFPWSDHLGLLCDLEFR
ncbi:MAG: endonuclease/exonuclease/phosphatase family protein [Nanoarchaeota archaeon]